jgi:two-component system cell cycle response regulator
VDRHDKPLPPSEPAVSRAQPSRETRGDRKDFCCGRTGSPAHCLRNNGAVMQIVLADASRITLRMLTTMLEARGHVVHPMTDGAEALKFISDNVEIDALITSIELTSLTGFELSWEVRLLSVARHRPLYIIVMSSSSDEKTISEALDSGADDFIRKPPSATALYARLRAAERLIGSETELIRLADRDPLTELLNRRAFFMGCKHAIDRAQVGRLSAIMADIDHFKQVNDRYGHDVGDQVIRAVAHEASLMSKLVGRLGGEEFAILLEGEPAETDFELAEGLRAKCSQIKFEFGTQSLAITCSLGVARWGSRAPTLRLAGRPGAEHFVRAGDRRRMG